MTPSRPYLLRALYEWIVDNNMTPHLVVNANFEGVSVPDQYVEDGQIILNVAPKAVRDLNMENREISFCTKFAGVIYNISLPIMSVTAIYAEENRKGMIFVDEELDFEEDEYEADGVENAEKSSSKSTATKNKRRPKLTVVASNPELDKNKQDNNSDDDSDDK